MTSVIRDFRLAHATGSGPLLASTLDASVSKTDPRRLETFYRDFGSSDVQQDIRSALLSHSNPQLRFSKAEGNAWVELYLSLWRAIGELLAVQEGSCSSWPKVYDAWKDVGNSLIRGYTIGGFESWTVPCLYAVGRQLRLYAIRADESGQRSDVLASADLQDDIADDQGANEKLEDAARMINKMFTLCLTDRAPLEESRKWGLYNTINLLFKTYFKLNSIGLSKNILRALQASRTDMPPLGAFPKSHIVTFKYYLGVIYFLEEDYEQAEENLTEAWRLCHPDAQRNRELILTYLVPCHLLTTHTLPTKELLAPFPRLQGLFVVLSACIKSGNLAGFDAAMAAGENEFVKRRIYLTLERGRDIALRNLLRKVWLAAGFEESLDGAPLRRKTRISVAEFRAGIRLSSGAQGKPIDDDEVECLLANMIYKNLMKGYISRERGVVVLSKGVPFPGIGG
ncbi:PCI domain-containing protein 2 [Agyrium rufum]|nr:PCI domain-containing protein 2 [Agyrium rufum]